MERELQLFTLTRLVSDELWQDAQVKATVLRVMHEDFLRSVGGAVVIGKVNVDHAEARERWEPPLRWWQRLAKRWLGREYGKWVVIHKLVMTATVLPDA